MRVTTGGTGVVSHAGTLLLAQVADATGLTAASSDVLAATRARRAGHDPGQVLTDLAVLLADGGEAISDLAVLRQQPHLYCFATWTGASIPSSRGTHPAPARRAVPGCPGGRTRRPSAP
ncbi:transposase [Kineococcus sp. TBRC 1896]|uniref:Transposase n=1 Tax=Kineococcus mangrovi TaxID=1660183 RepID=A0ABV4I3C9_9ACTN